MIARLFIAAALLFAVTPAHAEDEPTFTIKDHKFTPDTLTVPAKKNQTITVKNMDNSAEEFDSDDLGVEKVVPAGGTVKIHLKPLDPGTYKFAGEYHEDTAHGTVTAQ